MGTQSKHPVLFTVDQFLDPHTCTELRSEARQSGAVPARVSKSKSRVDVEQRRTSRVFVSPENEQKITRYLQGVQPQLSEHYKTELRGCENPQFLLYKRGDFYKAHMDKNDSPALPQYIKDRRLSVVIFLNNEDTEDGGYTGGSLVIYGVLEGPEYQKTGFRIQGKEGKLTTFPSNFMHEVETVRSGERFSIVSWFF